MRSTLRMLLGLFVWALALGLRAADPPPPPFINPEEAAGGPPPANWALTGGAPPAPEAPGMDLPPMPDAPDGALPPPGLPGAPEAPPAPLPGAPGAPAAPGATELPAESGENTVARPQISDDVMIRNRMEDVYRLYHAQEYEGAGRLAGQIIADFPKKQLYWIYYIQGLCLEQQADYRRARDCYRKVMELAPKSTYSNAATFRVGICEMKNGQEQEAIYTLREVIENNPRAEYRLQAYVHLGNLYRRQRDWKAAQRIYKDLIHLYPNTAWAYNATLYLAETYAHQGHNDSAVRIYEKIQTDPSVPLSLRAQAQLRIGDLFIADEKWLEALNAYRIALRDYAKVPGVQSVAQEKMSMATEGRRSGRLPYRPVGGPRAKEAPPDAGYQLKQQQESLPYDN